MWATVRRARLIRVIVVYLGASFAVTEAVDIFTEQGGLPGWVVSAAIVLLLLGLPIIIATALVQSAPSPPPPPPETAPAAGDTSDYESFARADAVGPTSAEPAAVSQVSTTAKHWLTWRKAILGGVLAFALLGVATTGYMVMRVMGIGPVGSLVAAGVLEARERIVLATFENKTPDSLLAEVVTEAFRIDLSQSPVVTVAEPGWVAGVLERMEMEPGTPLDVDLAREVATREGLRAVIAGEIGAAGESYVLSARIISAESGESFAAFRETARNSGTIVAALDRLSKKLRERAGESLKTIRANPPLDQVTTASLDALQKFTQARRAIYTLGDEARAIQLFEEALMLDSTFAEAWGELATIYANRDEQRALVVEAVTKLYQYRDRLTDRERYNAIGSYHLVVTGDLEKAIAAYRTLLESHPDDDDALHQMALLLGELRDFAQAEELYSRSIELDSSFAITFSTLMGAQVAQDKFAEAETTLVRMKEQVAGHPLVEEASSSLASSRGDYAVAETHISELRESRHESLHWRARTSEWLARLASVRGRLAEAEGHFADAMAAQEERGLPSQYLFHAFESALLDVTIRDAPAQGLRKMESALGRHPLESLEPLDRPYLFLAWVYAAAAAPERARELLAEYGGEVDPGLRSREETVLEHGARGALARAEGRYDDAIAEFRAWDADEPCTMCALADLARAYDSAGQADSAIVIYERFVTSPWFYRIRLDAHYLAPVFERLGTLYEERGDAEQAIYYYGRLVELWTDADPELQPRVDAARRAMQTLSTDR